MKVFCMDARGHLEKWLELSGNVLEESAGTVRSKCAPDFFRSSNGQVVTELHIGDMHASGPCDTLEKLEGDCSERASVKHAMIFRAGESETLEHLRRERTLTPEGCFVRSDSMWSVLRRCWVGEEQTFLYTPCSQRPKCFGSGEPRRDKETSSLCYGSSLVLCCTWETIEATLAIRLLACDLCDANEDSLRRFRKGLCGICTTQEISQRYTLMAMDT